MEIHFHRTDGAVERFIPSDPAAVQRILDDFQPDLIFAREKIIVADGDSLTSLLIRQVVRIDLVSESRADLMLPPGTVNAVELTGAEYQALRQSPEWSRQWNQRRERDVSEVAFLEVEMTGQPLLMLAVQLPMEPADDRPEAIRRPFHPLAAPGLCFQAQAGGIAALNPFHVVRLSLLPLPQEMPAAAWPARRIREPQPDGPALDIAAPADHPPVRLRLLPRAGQSHDLPGGAGLKTNQS